MRTVLLVASLMLAAALVLVLRSVGGNASRSGDEPAAPAMKGQPVVVAGPGDTLPSGQRIEITVRAGERMKGPYWRRVHDSVTVAGQAAWGWEERTLTEPELSSRPDHPGWVFLDVDGTGVGMRRILPKGAGDLVRIHVDRPNRGNGWSEGLTVIGFYDEPSSPPDFLEQPYACSRCDAIIVCGIAPICAE